MIISDYKIKAISIPCLLTILIGCNDGRTKKRPDDITRQKIKTIGQINNLWRTDTLTLFAEFDECGEWGGHSEIFKIYTKSDTPMTSSADLWFDYKRDSVDCSGDPNKNRKWVFKFSGRLTNEDQKKVIKYVHNLLDNSLSNKRPPTHSGQYYSVFNSDSTIVISNYGPPVEEFLSLRTRLVK